MRLYVSRQLEIIYSQTFTRRPFSRKVSVLSNKRDLILLGSKLSFKMASTNVNHIDKVSDCQSMVFEYQISWIFSRVVNVNGCPGCFKSLAHSLPSFKSFFFNLPKVLYKLLNVSTKNEAFLKIAKTTFSRLANTV